MVITIIDNIGIGLAMILATFFFHAYSLDWLIRIIGRILPRARKENQAGTHIWKILVLFLTAVGIILIHSAEIWAWAVLYLALDISAVHDFETALYFSTVSFSTVGYGDVVLSPDDRLLSAMQAASGMILFGWSTAFILEVLASTYYRLSIREQK